MKHHFFVILFLLIGEAIMAQTPRSLEDIHEMTQRILPNIVTIEINGYEEGYGFIISEEAGKRFIVTAYHVLNPTGDPRINIDDLVINVGLYEHAEPMKASVCYYSAQGSSDRVNDIAVLQLDSSVEKNNWEENCLASLCSQYEGAETFVVKNWEIPIYKGKRMEIEWGQLRGSNGTILEMDWDGLIIGYSGGPVFNECGIIGMLQNARHGKADVLKIDEIIAWMEVKNQMIDPLLYYPAPFDLKPTLGYKKISKGLTWALIGPALVFGGGGAILYHSGQNNYADYKTHCIETDPFFTDFSRDDLFNKANFKHKFAQGLWIGSAVLATTVIIGKTKLFTTHICKEMPGRQDLGQSYIQYGPDFIPAPRYASLSQKGVLGFSLTIGF